MLGGVQPGTSKEYLEAAELFGVRYGKGRMPTGWRGRLACLRARPDARAPEGRSPNG